MNSALLNAQNRVGVVPITSATFQYSNNGDDWFNIPAGGVGPAYTGNPYEVRVFSTTPAGATYTIVSNPTATNAGQTIEMVIQGSGGFSGTIISPQLLVTKATPTVVVSPQGFPDDNFGFYYISVAVFPSLAQGIGIGYSDNYGGFIGNLTGSFVRVSGYDSIPAPATLSYSTNDTANWANTSGSIFLPELG
jgi:hypothetical protein